MTKRFRTIWVIYLMYATIMVVYILSTDPSRVPVADQGGPSDPKTFLNDHQLLAADHLSKVEYIAFFLVEPLRWILYVILLTSGYNAYMKRLAGYARWRLVQDILYCFLLLVTLFVINFPIHLFFYIVDHAYHLSDQPIGSWMMDLLKSLGVDLVTQIPAFLAVYGLIRKSPIRWWLYTWILAIPVSVFLLVVQPLVLDPIFNTFQPLPNSQLRTEIMGLANQAGIPTDKIYVVDKSKQTNELNAYVTGFGNTTRIVYWDTLLKEMDKGEVLFVTAHEMGHYVKHHIYKGLLIGLAMAFLLLYLFAKVYRFLVQRFGRRLKLDGEGDVAALPLALLLYSLVSFWITPVENAISRTMEHEADAYAYALTHDKADGIKVFQTFARTSLQGVNPPSLVYWFLDDHPTLLQRIDFLRNQNP
jgi:STE24 endopeptidase